MAALKGGDSRSSVSGRAVAKLSDEVHGYHIEVTQALATMQADCLHCRKQVNDLDLQINGEKPERDDAPSMKADIKSLKQSRTSLRRGVQFSWAVISAIGGLVGTIIAYKPWK